jgi:hypothetical protein
MIVFKACGSAGLRVYHDDRYARSHSCHITSEGVSGVKQKFTGLHNTKETGYLISPIHRAFPKGS